MVLCFIEYRNMFIKIPKKETFIAVSIAYTRMNSYDTNIPQHKNYFSVVRSQFTIVPSILIGILAQLCASVRQDLILQGSSQVTYDHFTLAMHQVSDSQKSTMTATYVWQLHILLSTDINILHQYMPTYTIQVLYGECIVNPTMTLLDVEGFGALGKSLPGVVTMVDATFASPYLLQPMKYGVDIVMHSW